MKFPCLRDVPSLFIIFISFAASFLMGCSGGGGGGGGSDDPSTPSGPAPASLEAGMQFRILADEYRYYYADNSYWFGSVDKTIVIVSEGSAAVTDNLNGGTSTGAVSFVRHNNNRVDLIIENYPYRRLGMQAFATMKVELTFQSTTSGAAYEKLTDASVRYEFYDGGTFTYTPPTTTITP